jgi:uncharacterized membrane protein HdeD (DUF308 family)
MTNLTSRTITGIIMTLAGIALIVVSFFSTYSFIVYGVAVLLVGLFIMFNKNEDKIERRMDSK